MTCGTSFVKVSNSCTNPPLAAFHHSFLNFMFLGTVMFFFLCCSFTCTFEHWSKAPTFHICSRSVHDWKRLDGWEAEYISLGQGPSWAQLGRCQQSLVCDVALSAKTCTISFILSIFEGLCSNFQIFSPNFVYHKIIYFVDCLLKKN